MKVVARVTIDAPVEKVFEVFTDFKNAEKRLKGVKAITFLEKDGKPEVGMKWRETRVMFGKEATEEMWITSITKNTGYVVEAESHGTKYRTEYTFTERDGVTEVTLEFAGTPVTFGASLGALLMFMFKGSVKKALRSDMDDLKRVIEGEGAAS